MSTLVEDGPQETESIMAIFSVASAVPFTPHSLGRAIITFFGQYLLF